ncbi:MAG: type I-U CRISPR-associated protein Cas7 [Fibrobacteres bacterium]|nr:type I-U CRISPR-associated protein Cas7 [Fibrobacterota bacterium]
MPTTVLDLAKLSQIVASASALRYRARLQPAGGPGDKVFPPTYEGGKYAEEKRRINGATYDCVHLDSVQSQANRMELALLEAVRDGLIELPVVEVDFASKGEDLVEVGKITSLDAPHRLADAILRDSVDATGTNFRKTTEGGYLNTASLKNATGLFEISPTSLLFGLWDSTGPRGGLGVKFQRAIVSELVAIDAITGVKSSSRLDPLGIQLAAGPIFHSDAKTGEWALSPKDSSGKALVKVGKEGKPSEVNHGNVTPSVSGLNGGVTFAYASQATVLSLPALRRLQFPLAGKREANIDRAAQATLAALGLAAATLSIAKGVDLRSRCLLVPEGVAQWEIVESNGETKTFALSVEDACKLLKDAVTAAVASGLKWRKEPLVLAPSEGLAQLVRKSRELAAKTPASEA